MSMKSVSHNKLHEVTNLLAGVASNCDDPATAIRFIESARDWYEDEIVRLRALVKDAERVDGYCPWCGCCPNYSGGDITHADDCPAFTPEGEVR